MGVVVDDMDEGRRRGEEVACGVCVFVVCVVEMRLGGPESITPDEAGLSLILLALCF